MCVRFIMYSQPRDQDDFISEMMQSSLIKKFRDAGACVLTGGEARPTNVVPVIAPDRNGIKTVFPMRWGFRVPGLSLVVNARTETAAVRPTFRDAWRQHRCAIPAESYIEWEHIAAPNGKTRTGDKFSIHPAEEPVTWLCGLYRIEDGLPVFTVLTREPSESVRHIHDRMPLILPESLIDAWVDPGRRAEDLLGHAVTALAADRMGGADN
ncbi:MAG: SOS response-associated peptidase family protein [Oscillospiraceae bacterium]|nr:SOS response-associated peptidase family protein [Oscillospiraceae bacterium]